MPVSAARTGPAPARAGWLRGPPDDAIGCSVIECARASGVQRITYHSVVHPHTPDVSFHFEKCRVQIALLESGLPYTLLQATNYMQNLRWVWPQVLRTGEFPMPYSAEQPVTWVDLEDLAEATARVVAEPGHACATYELVGTAPLPRTELAAILSRVLGRPVRAVRLDPDGAFERLARFTPEEQARVRTMYRHYDRCGFRAGHPRMLGLLLGREPTSYEAFARRFVREHS